MTCEIIAVGSELLLPGRTDENGAWLVERLLRAGVAVTGRTVVGDDVSAIAGRAREALARATLVLVSGGLGPTSDDRTREALALALDVPLARDPDELARLARSSIARGRAFTLEQARQADRPQGSTWIPNPVGTASGLRTRVHGASLVALPGVPAELRTMFDAAVAPGLEPGRRCLRVLHTAGRTESEIETSVEDLYRLPNIAVTILAGPTGVDLVLVADGDGALLDDAERRFRARLGDDLHGVDGETLEGVVGALLVARRLTVATGESCTAGLLGAALTAVAGASDWYRGGLVAYHDEVKIMLAGVEAGTLAARGAVSAEVAAELGRRARVLCAADIGIGVTGIAGPGGATPDKPVGLVHVALADARGVSGHVLRLGGDRDTIRRRATTLALDLLRRRLARA